MAASYFHHHNSASNAAALTESPIGVKALDAKLRQLINLFASLHESILATPTHVSYSISGDK
jgi:hypothetical protein